MWKSVLGGPMPEPDADFFLAGGDSLQLIKLVVEVSARYGRDFDYERFFEMPTLATLVTLLDER
jgi:acyl carrier protein